MASPLNRVFVPDAVDADYDCYESVVVVVVVVDDAAA